MIRQSRVGVGSLVLMVAVVSVAGCASVDAYDVGAPVVEGTLALSPEESKLAPEVGSGDLGFGTSVAVWKERALVGWNSQLVGGAHVFIKTSEGWVREATLKPSDGTLGDQFGSSVALEGDTAIVGAFLGVEGGRKQGAAYVFVRDASGVWSEQAKVVASDGAGLDLFGRPVALSGETLLVGAFNGEKKRGAAYVFVRDGVVWSEQAKLVASDGEPLESFGISVALSGETAVVGAYADNEQGDASGSAYVFERDGEGWWERAKLLPDDGAAYDFFGEPVAVSGATVMVGSYTNNSAGPDAGGGAVYVYAREGKGWVQEAKLAPSDVSTADEFGISISLSSAGAVIGSHYANAPASNAGSAYLFSKCKGEWTEKRRLLGSDGAIDSEFGTAVSMSSDGSLVGVGTPRENSGAGAVYMFELGSDSFCASDLVCDAAGVGRESCGLKEDGSTRGRRGSGSGMIPLDRRCGASGSAPGEEKSGEGCPKLPLVPTLKANPSLALSQDPLFAGGGSACAIGGGSPAAPRGLAALLLAAGASLARRRKARTDARSR